MNTVITQFAGVGLTQGTSAGELVALGTGLHPEIPMDEYIALPYMSASRLEKLRRSPLQYLHSLTQPVERRAVLEKGTALHLAVLEPQLFEGHYVILGQCEGITKKGDRCSNGGSIYRHQRSFCGIHDPMKGQPIDETIEVISQADYDAVLGMREAILGHPRARSLFVGRGEFEATVIFDDPTTGVRCKCRPDRLIERAGMLVDIKTTFNAAPYAFPRQAENLGYFRKLAFYRTALLSIGWPHKETAVLAIESAAPHDLVCYLLDAADLDSADAEVTRLMNLFKQCMESGEFPGYADEFAILQRPAWAKDSDE